MNKLLFYSLESWDEVWRRNQFICRGLTQRHQDLEILWVNPAIDAWSAAGKYAFVVAGIISGQPDKPSAVDDYPTIKVVQPLKALPNSLGGNFNSWLIKRHVELVLDQLGWQRWTIWVNNQAMRSCLPAMAQAVPGKSCDKLVYDITDDWSAAGLPKRILERVERDDAWLLAQADEVIVCSKALQERKSKVRPTVRLVPNGVDAERLRPDNLAKLERPPELKDITQRIAGYTGTLHEDRLDIDLILQLTERLPHIKFAFVGPDCLQPGTRNRLRARKNCLLLGARNYQTVPAYMAAFDILIVPHKISAFTDSLDPLKLYEYMGTGKPVVATACGGFRDHQSLITLAANADDFARAITAGLAGNAQESRQARIDWAAKQSWQSRLEMIEQILF